ncbi:MAG: sigma 54-interacting transcriptional regulator [Sandaracinaceae bacterium]|nr:MAG: sigma 54-dependent Fis family transcriptional regulator [Sandaracinaceae bacterium]
MTQPRTAHVGDPRVLELPRCALVILSGDDRGREQIIEGDLFRIGKSKGNDLVLPDETVSRAHCEIVRDDRGYLLRDLGSTNGTLLDGAEIKEAWLKTGAVITVGKVELKVRPFHERVEILPSDAASYGEVAGKSVGMRQVFGLLERLGPTDATVLIGGETGTGKDVLARSIHAQSPRAKRPFIVVDCGAVVGSLIESELFGHEKGAFTGASATRQGAFELADGGTLFLDEIGELPLDLQPKLLRALETRAFRRVGGNQSTAVDIRVIAASKRNLKMEVERGKFREDLYFRLAVVPVELPPLRERLDDIPLLVGTLLARIAEGDATGSTPTDISPETLDALRAHDWPGNIRELRNVLERAAYLSRAAGHDEVSLGFVPLAGAAQPNVTKEIRLAPDFEPGKSYRDTKSEWEALFEKQYVGWLLDQSDGNISAAARAADMDRKYLHKLARKHGLHPKK